MRAVALLSGAAALLLSGCVSSWRHSYNRWEALGQGPFSAWASCIDDRARGYLNSEKPDAPPAWAKSADTHDLEVVFTWVLAACSEHMKGPAWRALKEEQVSRLIGDAYRHLVTVDVGIQAALQEAQI